MTVDSWLRKLNIALSLLCMVLVLYAASTWLRAPQIPEAPRSTSFANQDALRPWQWFIKSTAAPQQARAEALEEARLGAKLLGVVYAADKATATLSVSGRAEKVYKAGEEIQSGVRIEAIEPYRVVVVHNGKRQQISIAKSQLSLQGNTDSSSPDSAPLAPGFALGEMFNAVPVSLGDQNSGLKLDSLSAEMQQLAELQDGDVIVSIDNQAVEELLASPAQWMKYTTNTALPVTILRDGQQLVVNVNAPALALRILPALGRQD
jgi:type II secretory pathway component PulC